MSKKLDEADRRYAVYCQDGGVPTVIHEHFKAADHAAWDMARKHPGKRFHILSTGAIRVFEQPVEQAA